MTTRLNPYLQFLGTAREAITFYGEVFGGTPDIMAFSDMGGMGMPEDHQHLVMHSWLGVSDTVSVMAADVPEQMRSDYNGNGVVSLSGDEVDVLRGWFEALSADGEVHMPMEKAPWGDYFGQCRDKFGVVWLVNASEPTEG